MQNQTITCSGNGECIRPCICKCFDKNDIDNYICRCDHSGHGGYCPSATGCCITHKCRFCDYRMPMHMLEIRNGMCGNCYFEMGPVKFTDKMEECPICLEMKLMVLVNCEKHLSCFECWKSHCKEGKGRSCPICRKPIWKQKWINDLKDVDLE